MTVPTSFLSATAVLGSTLVLAACGGSDSGSLISANNPGSTTSTSGSSITAGNMKEIAAHALFASGGLSEQSNPATSSGTSSGTNATGPGLIMAAVNQVYTAQSARAVIPLPTITLNCNQGGTLLIELDTASTSRLSSGDSLVATASSCVHEGDRLNGSVHISVPSLNGTPSSTSAWSGTFGVTFTNFTFDDGSDVDGLNGDISLSFNQTAPGTASFGISGNSLNLTDTRGGATVERTLSAFSSAGSVASDVFTYRTSFTLSGNASALAIGNGPYTVNTTTDFVQQRRSAPSAGVLVVRASDNSSLTLTTVDTTNVNIGADLTGDGVVDQTLPTTWRELETFLRSSL